jgi:beta-aspartyl-peptidase (threonine type)
VIAVHGGAGAIHAGGHAAADQEAWASAIEQAVLAGLVVLESRGSAIEAVAAAVHQMEDDPLFNAGYGSVFTSQGDHQLDAAIMCGKTQRAGAVSAVRHVRNPVRLAQRILERGEFILLTGDGAEEYALECGVELVANKYFSIPRRRAQLERARRAEIVALDHDAAFDTKHGTVGAVALDAEGRLAAATSTGGLTNKAFGRVGDSPLIGCGTYANDLTCAVSCTGKGEEFIRHVVAHDLHCLMAYRGLGLDEACRTVFTDRMGGGAGIGGLVAIDRHGNIACPFNTTGMYRGWARVDGTETVVGLFGDPEPSASESVEGGAVGTSEPEPQT